MSLLQLRDIKARLVGLDGWLSAAAASNAQYDDDKIAALIPAMVRRFERESQFSFQPRQISTHPDGTYPGSSVRPLVKESAYPYSRDAVDSFMETFLKHKPVQSVQRARIMFGNQLIYQFPEAWYAVDGPSAKFYLLPVYGAQVTAQVYTSLAILQTGFYRDEIPLALHFDYIAGLPDGTGGTVRWQDDPEWADLGRALEEYCALAVLNDIAHLADAGLGGKSVGGGGSSESLSYTRFADRKKELADSVAMFQETLKDQETPVFLGFV